MSVHIRRLCSVDDRTGLMDRPSGGGAMEVYDGIGHEHPPKAEIGPIENLIRHLSSDVDGFLCLKIGGEKSLPSLLGPLHMGPNLISIK
jgi:hypothetical protein